MTIQCLIIWEVKTPHHNILNVNARSGKEAKEKTMQFIESTPMNKIKPTNINDLIVFDKVKVIDACIL